MITLNVHRIPIYAKQAEFRHSPAWVRGFCAGRGSGKTKIGALDILLRAKKGEPFMCVSPSYVVMEDTTFPVFLETAEKLNVHQRSVKSPIPRISFRTQDGGSSQIVFRSGDDPESLRGPSKAGVWLDEASLMSDMVYKLATATLRHEGRMGRMTLTFTPKGKRHWTYGVFFDENGDQRPNTHLTTARTIDNPFLPEEFYDLIRGEYSSALAAQELEGQFVELSGIMFRYEWFGSLVPGVPIIADRVRYWDKAGTEGGGAYTAGVLMARDDSGVFYVEDVVRGQWSYLQREETILRVAHEDAAKYANTVQIYFEQEPGSGGKESAQQTIKKLQGFPVYRDIVSGQRYQTKDRQRVPGEAKIVRAQPLAAQVEAGNVRINAAPWNADFLSEVCAFPEYGFMDQVDAAAGAFNKLNVNANFNYEAPQDSPRQPLDSLRHGVKLDRRSRFTGGRRG